MDYGATQIVFNIILLTSEIPMKFTGRGQILNFKKLGNSTTDLICINRTILANKLHMSALGQPKWP